MLHTVLLEASSNESCVLDGYGQVHQDENKCSASITFHSSYLVTSHSKDTCELFLSVRLWAGTQQGATNMSFNYCHVTKAHTVSGTVK